MLTRPQPVAPSMHFPLKGSVLAYEDPTKPVAVADWDVLLGSRHLI